MQIAEINEGEKEGREGGGEGKLLNQQSLDKLVRRRRDENGY